MRHSRDGAGLRALRVRDSGHGVEVGGEIYCCAHCAEHKGGLKDRA